MEAHPEDGGFPPFVLLAANGERLQTSGGLREFWQSEWPYESVDEDSFQSVNVAVKVLDVQGARCVDYIRPFPVTATMLFHHPNTSALLFSPASRGPSEMHQLASPLVYSHDRAEISVPHLARRSRRIDTPSRVLCE